MRLLVYHPEPRQVSSICCRDSSERRVFCACAYSILLSSCSVRKARRATPIRHYSGSTQHLRRRYCAGRPNPRNRRKNTIRHFTHTSLYTTLLPTSEVFSCCRPTHTFSLRWPTLVARASLRANRDPARSIAAIVQFAGTGYP